MKKSVSTFLISTVLTATLAGCEAEDTRRLNIDKVMQSFELTTTEGQKYTISRQEESAFEWQATGKIQSGKFVLYLTNGNLAFPFQIPRAGMDLPYAADATQAGNLKYLIDSVKVSASETSQGVGISITSKKNSSQQVSARSESCTITEEVSVCHNGKCKDITVKRSGSRNVDTTRTSESDYNLVLRSAAGSVLMTATISGYTSSHSLPTSPCY